jgi:hypothetical protein
VRHAVARGALPPARCDRVNSLAGALGPDRDPARPPLANTPFATGEAAVSPPVDRGIPRRFRPFAAWLDACNAGGGGALCAARRTRDNACAP